MVFEVFLVRLEFTMSYRLKNGRFVKQKTAIKIKKALAAMSDAKKKESGTTNDEIVQSHIPDEHSIVSLRELAKNIKCNDCRVLLDLQKLTDYTKKGLHVMFRIKCDKCAKINFINTGAIRNEVSEINSSVILGKLLMF